MSKAQGRTTKKSLYVLGYTLQSKWLKIWQKKSIVMVNLEKKGGGGLSHFQCILFFFPDLGFPGPSLKHATMLQQTRKTNKQRGSLSNLVVQKCKEGKT